MPEFINKYISITPNDWERLKEYSKRPENRRPPGSQAGMIIKAFLDEHEKKDNTHVQKTN